MENGHTLHRVDIASRIQHSSTMYLHLLMCFIMCALCISSVYFLVFNIGSAVLFIADLVMENGHTLHKVDIASRIYPTFIYHVSTSTYVFHYVYCVIAALFYFLVSTCILMLVSKSSYQCSKLLNEIYLYTLIFGKSFKETMCCFNYLKLP